ncbi:MAG: pleD 3 [Gemmataceae bacterium]|nr:pleD 3 [Gemmataceae bacterium]
MTHLAAIRPKGREIAPTGTINEDVSPTFKIPERNPVNSVIQEAYLVYIYPTGPRIGTRYRLGYDTIIIGRNEDCQVRNTDASVSRTHAKIVRDDDGHYRVVDLGSSNGTFVNNVSGQDAVLQDGDYLRVGNCIYRFLGGGNIEAEYHEEIYRLTVMDGLTQVHNRRYLIEFLDREVSRAGRHGRPLALALLDIDHFKAVNDRRGHLAGDLALRELCARVRAVIRPEDLLARYGGEEFAVVMPEADAATASGIAERIRIATSNRPFVFNGQPYPLTVSAGVATTLGETGLGVADLLKRADENLYRAKTSGRDRVVLS